MFQQQVYCRVKALNDVDIQGGAQDIVQIEGQQLKIQGETYNFNQLTKGDIIQMNQEIKEVDQWFFTYGACSTGKTSTMFGENGVIFQICGMYINHFKDQKKTLSMIEVRESQLIDQFTDKEVKLQESNSSFSCQNLTTKQIDNLDQFTEILKSGLLNRYMNKIIMNRPSCRFCQIVKLGLPNFSIQFCDMMAYEKPSPDFYPPMLKQISINNTALSQFDLIIGTKNEKERLLLANSTLMTKIMKNAFKTHTSIILCISSADNQIKNTIKTLSILK